MNKVIQIQTVLIFPIIFSHLRVTVFTLPKSKHVLDYIVRLSKLKHILNWILFGIYSILMGPLHSKGLNVD